MRRTVLWLGLSLALWFTLLFQGQATAQVFTPTLSSIETQVRLLLRDTSNDVSFQRFSNATIDGYINEGQRQFNNDAWVYQGSFTMGLTAGQIEYALPSDFIAIVRLTISNIAIPQVSEAGLDGGGSNSSPNYIGVNWTLALSTPTAYYINEFVTGAPPNIGFNPTPKFTSVGSVFVQYVRQVPAMVNETDNPFNGNVEFYPYTDAIADFAAARCWMILGRSDMTTSLMGMYTARAAQARANLNKMPNFLPGAAGNRGPRQ